MDLENKIVSLIRLFYRFLHNWMAYRSNMPGQRTSKPTIVLRSLGLALNYRFLAIKRPNNKPVRATMRPDRAGHWHCGY